jgi:hypothetical protein
MEEVVAKMEALFGVNVDKAKVLRDSAELAASERDRYDRAVSILDPRNDLRLSFMKSNYDALARVQIRTGLARGIACEAYEQAKSANLLATTELEAIRREIEDRYEALKLPLPVMYHEAGCDCETCRPLDGA